VRNKNVTLSGSGGAMFLNNCAWTIFLHSDDKLELDKALAWSEHSLLLDSVSYLAPNNMDTKANLLYKLGGYKEAFIWEEKAINLDPGNSEFKKTLMKMKNKESTWSQE
jgi:tetratricopeptide (TPR) repeat protein